MSVPVIIGTLVAWLIAADECYFRVTEMRATITHEGDENGNGRSVAYEFVADHIFVTESEAVAKREKLNAAGFAGFLFTICEGATSA